VINIRPGTQLSYNTESSTIQSGIIVGLDIRPISTAPSSYEIQTIFSMRSGSSNSLNVGVTYILSTSVIKVTLQNPTPAVVYTTTGTLAKGKPILEFFNIYFLNFQIIGTE
jgi:hypothetical protein